MANTVALTRLVVPDAFIFTSNVATGDTVVIGAITYRFQTTPSQAYDVDVGADLDTSIASLVLAINRTGTPGATTYHTDTVAHPAVTAAADLANDAIDLTARIAGADANAIYLAATHPGANTIAALAVSAGTGAGVTAGVGSVDDFLTSLFALNQINSEVLAELKKLTDADD